jgi:hypothetical protein
MFYVSLLQHVGRCTRICSVTRFNIKIAVPTECVCVFRAQNKMLFSETVLTDLPFVAMM